MGQNNSSNFQTRSAPSSPRGKPQKPPPPRPAAPPQAPPQTPKVPNYAVPENRVLPMGASEMPDKRRLLRPVSQELSKFHPDFVDLFRYEEENGAETKGGEESGGGQSPDKAGANGSVVRDGKENYHVDRESPTSALDDGGLSSSRFSHTTPGGDLNRKPNNIELSRSHSLQEKRSNGHVLMNGHVSSNPNGSDVVDSGKNGTEVSRTNSLDRSTSGPAKIRAHKRFPSASTSLANEASVIPEDPREHLYSHWRQDPFSNPTPAVTSLPMKNTFDLDYKMNLTYAQLAEHRRQKRLADLEDKTGKKLSDLNADLQEQSTVPVSPFDRNNYTPSAPSAPSTATASSDTGVSKSKKRRAPPPPGVAAPRDSSPGRLSLDVEPPADYDLDDPSPPLDGVSPWKPNLSRQNSTASAMSAMSKSSKGSKGPAPAPPPPPVVSAPAPAVSAQSPQRSEDSKPNATPPPSGTPPSKTAPPISAASARLIAQAKAELEALKRLEVILKDKDSEKAKVEAEGKDKEAEDPGDGSAGAADNETQTAAGDTDAKGKEKEEEEPTQATDGKDSPMSFSSGDTENSSSNGKAEGDKGSGLRRLNSLLQHDIVLAARARGAKGQVKAKTPVQHVKPKDPAQLFREELAKAATAREERVKSVESEKEKDGEAKSQTSEGKAGDEDEAVVFKSDLVKVKRKAVVSEVSAVGSEASVGKPVSPPVSPRPESLPPETKMCVSKSVPDLVGAGSGSEKGGKAALSRQRPPEGYNGDGNTLRKSASHDGVLDLSDDDDVRVNDSSEVKASSSPRQFTEDWKPEDDLDSDDDMRDDLTYSRSGALLEASDGFKSSIIPSRVDDLKSAKRKSSKSGRRESGSSTDERNKFGSIRKFQKSVHKGVRNAFGSISKASGKLLRRNKSHDFEQDDVEGRAYRTSKEDEGHPKCALTNGMDGHERMNGHLSESDDDDDDLEVEDHEDLPTVARSDKQMRMMKRAGVAYVGRKGQIVVLPEFETVRVDEEGNVVDDKEDEGRAPRIFKKKKKKFTYESTVRRQEKDRTAQQYAVEVREKERQMEFERRRQQEMEREFQRLRDIETQERLQRLQTAQLQQQMNLLQQQHQHLTSMQLLQGPSLPAHPQQRYSVPEFTSHHGAHYTSAAGLGGLGAPLPPANMSSYSLQSPPFVTPPSTTTATTVGGYDVNYLSNYMRMMGIQPPTTQQQWAFLLTSVSGVNPHGLLDSSSKGQALLVGPDLSHLFASKAAPPCSDTSALVAQKSSLLNLLASGPLPQALAADGTVSVTAPDPAALLTKRLPVSSPTSMSPPQAAVDTSADKLIPDGAERSNPVYFSSDDEEQLAQKAQQRVHNSDLAKDGRRPRSSVLPLPHSNVYRDVTSREEAAVTRVQVPDYRQPHSAAYTVVDEVGDDADDSSEEDLRTMNERVLRSVSGASGKASAGAGQQDGSEPTEDGFRTVQLTYSGSATGGSRALPPKVYGPMGFKPVAFTPGNPGTKLQTEGSVDR